MFSVRVQFFSASLYHIVRLLIRLEPFMVYFLGWNITLHVKGGGCGKFETERNQPFVSPILSPLLFAVPTQFTSNLTKLRK